MKALLVSADPGSVEFLKLAVGGLERRLGTPVEFAEAPDGERGAAAAWRFMPDVVIADETASRAGAFALAKDLRGQREPFPGAIVILLDREEDSWLARWSGADAWFVKPIDPFELAEGVWRLVTKKEPV